MLEQIKEILATSVNVNPDKVTYEATLDSDLGIDSLDSVELVLEVETRYNIQISDEEILGINTVKDLIEIIETKIN